MPLEEDEIRWRRLIEECFRREAGSQAALPDATQDLIETGVLDSMGWVSFLRTLESASDRNDLGSQLTGRIPSFESILLVFREARAAGRPLAAAVPFPRQVAEPGPVLIAASSVALGSRIVASEEVDKAFGMPHGKLRLRAGIESVAYAAEKENEHTLGTRAGKQALQSASCAPQELDWIIATSETHHAYPSLSAELHSQLLARETCGALDVGGACLGLLNGFAVAQALITAGKAQSVLVVTADVHSRVFRPGQVTGEFGGLFGDGASAFLLRSSGDSPPQNPYAFGEFFFGSAGQYMAAISVTPAPVGGVDLYFDGEALSRAAITKLEKVVVDVEHRSGIARSSVKGVATHQPNPRLVTLLAKQLDIPEDRFPIVARTFGNLGSSTSGVALDSILRDTGSSGERARAPIFLASLGPGLLFGGGWLVPA
jgi:3-oxoacyl-[acyl-carrier-protein] synthase III